MVNYMLLMYVSFQSFKTATSVLLDGEGNFEAFGFDAEEKYAMDSEAGRSSKSLFRHFKMMLHQQEVLFPSPFCSVFEQ